MLYYSKWYTQYCYTVHLQSEVIDLFKTSITKAKMALSMDASGEHFLNSEYCFFDGKHNRCRGYITLTASVYHPLLRRQIPLAIMEVEKENTTNIELFWTLFNEVLEKVAKRPSKFNPTGWCTDMAGANLSGIHKVFGDSARIKSCEFHFKDHRNKKAKKLDPDSAGEFKTLCDDLLNSTTEDAYNSAKKKMDEFITAKEDRKFLENWVSWWHARRGFIFRAFAPRDAPEMNQAEVIHAGWTHRDRANLSLLDVCQADIRDTLLLDVELTKFQSGSAPGGSGPSYAERKSLNHQRQLQKAKRIGKEMFPDENSGYLVDPKSSHCPRPKPNKTKKQNTASSSTTVGSQAKSAGAKSAGTTSVSTTQNRMPHLPSPSFAASTTPFLPRMFQNLPNTAASAPPPNLLHSNFHGNIPSTSFVNEFHYQRPDSDPQTQQFSYTPTFSHSLTNSTVTNNTSCPVDSPWQTQMFSTTPIFSSTATNRSSNTDTSNGNPTNPFGSSWHSGMAPNRYEIVLLERIVKKCYGCLNDFVDKYRSSPYNLVIKHLDRRVTGKDGTTGRLLYSNTFSNTYYHLNSTHIQKRNPFFNGRVYISPSLHSRLDYGQQSQLQSCGLNIVVQ